MPRMDEVVLQAMLKWPQVPACWGWLGLDARGQWYLRDAQAQALGAFTSGVHGARGTRLVHERLIDFIGRNYAADARGHWYFQNGPQRVFVELESTPWVWRVGGASVPGAAPLLCSHTGTVAEAMQTWLDEAGLLYVRAAPGLGRVHPQDMLAAAEAIEAGHWPAPATLRAADMPQRFGYCRSPQAVQQSL